jgi:hypothetical protein
MKIRSAQFLFCLFCLLPFTLFATTLDDYKNIVSSSFASVEEHGKTHWSLNRLRSEDNGDGVEVTEKAFDPSKPEGQQWTLLKIDNQPPSANRQSEYRQQKPSYNRT